MDTTNDALEIFGTCFFPFKHCNLEYRVKFRRKKPLVGIGRLVQNGPPLDFGSNTKRLN